MSSNAPPDSSPAGNSETETPEQDQLMEQYKTYLDTIARSAEERLHINELFMTINNFITTILTAIGGYVFVSGNNSIFLLLALLSIMGYAFSRVWHLYLTNYTTVNSVKWDVLYALEQELSYHPFKSEWDNYLKGYMANTRIPKTPLWIFWKKKSKSKYKPYYSTSEVESALPKLFGALYLVIGLGAWIYWLHSNWSENTVEFLENIWHLCGEWVGVLIIIFLLIVVIALRSVNGRE